METDESFLKKSIKKDLQTEAVQSTSEKLGEFKEFKEKIPKKKKHSFWKVVIPLLFFTLLIIIAGIIFIYFFYVNSSFSNKAYLEKSVLEDSLGEDHIAWILNELGTYELHKKPFGRTAQMQITVTDLDKEFTATIIDGIPKVLRTQAPRADILIELEFTDVKDIYDAKNALEKAQELADKGRFRIIRVSPKDNLVMKGYRDFYNDLSDEKIGFINIFILNDTVKAILYFVTVILVSFFSINYLRNNKLFD